MVVPDGCLDDILGIVLIARPEIIRLFCIFVGTIGRCWKVLRAAFYSLSKKIVLLEGNITHPCRVVSTIATAVFIEIRKVVVIHGVRPAVPRFVFILGVNSTLIIWAICAIWIPIKYNTNDIYRREQTNWKGGKPSRN